MKILLVNPPFHRLKGLKLSYFPLGLGYLGSSLKQAGFDVKLYQAENPRENLARPLLKNKNQLLFHTYKNYQDSLDNTGHPVWNEIAAVMELEKPDLVGVSCMTPYFSSALQVARIAKEVNPACRVVFGGQHPTLKTDEVMAKEHVDFAVRGEGEKTLVQLCRAIDKNESGLETIDGLSFRNGNGPVHNRDRGLIRNLDDLPFPLRTDLVFPELFSPPDLGVVVTSRGCPFECTFCSAKSMWTRKVRFRTTGNIIEELKQMVHSLNLREFFFWDDSFTANRKRVMDLCRAIIDEHLPISWGCTTRLDLIDDELLGLMKKAGCSQMDVGIESGSEPILKKIKKGINLRQINRGLELINRKSIFPTAFFMIGFPEETDRDIQQTFNLMKSIDATLTFSIFTPYPGTELYQDMERDGMVSEITDWSALSHQSPNNFFSRHMDRQTFMERVEEGSRIVDDHNSHFRYKVKYLKNNLGFYLKNPRSMIHKARKYV